MPITTVLFDLDGTLSDSSPGILSSLRQAFAVVGLAPLSPEQEWELLGPPFYESLPPLVGADVVPSIIEAYRTFYSGGGMFDTVAYDEIADVLERLGAAGCTLAVATSKPEYYALPIVEQLAFRTTFATVCGDTLEGTRPSKALVVGEALRRLGDPDPRTVLMVGDRSHDVLGAAAHAIGCLGAGWGYGAPGELEAAGALAVFDHPAELGAYLATAIGPLQRRP